MDGSQRAVTRSLQFKLSTWIAGVIAGIALAAGIFSFTAAFIEANELQDDQLRQVAALIDQQIISPTLQMTESEYNNLHIDSEARLIIQELSAAAVNQNTPNLVLPTTLPDGLQTLRIHNNRWRVYVKTLHSGHRIALAQDTALRDEIARDGALRTVLPFIILIPILIGITSILIRRMLQPIRQLASSVDHRSDQELGALTATEVPDEIQPFIDAINRLLLRVARSVEIQRRFVADAAHELRSPLTALSLQAEGLATSEMPLESKQRVHKLHAGLKRSRLLLEQLLALARAQDQQKNRTTSLLSMQKIFRQVLESLMPLAEAKNIDIGVLNSTDITINANETEVMTLVKNLIDNAIRYTPENGQVDIDVAQQDQYVVITVQDSGPGIPLDEQTRVFDPFYRVLGNEAIGSGLGLSIVQTIIERMNGFITLENRDEQGGVAGLKVTAAVATDPI
jgi:two-component system, OmpR family, sensor kinase